MAAVSVTINGVIWDKQWRTARPVVLIGEAFLTGLEVGGGPIIGGGEGEKPPHIWGGGNVPMPTPPIGNLPGYPNWPTFPNPWPDPPQNPPEDPSIVKPPPPEGGWGWSPEYGWGYFPGSGGAGPKK